MSRQIQIRRGTAAENDAFTGAIGEVTMDTTNKTLRVHDGTTAGGTKLAKQSEIADLTNADYVIESQIPTAENNYTWYRKYKSGWVEQGGQMDLGSDKTTAGYQINVTLSVEMSDTNYHKSIIPAGNTAGSSYLGYCCVNTANCTTTILSGWFQKTEASYRYFCWEVKGVAASE